MLIEYNPNKLVLARAVARNYSKLFGRGALVWVMGNHKKQISTQKAFGDPIIEVCTHESIRLNDHRYPDALALFRNGRELNVE